MNTAELNDSITPSQRITAYIAGLAARRGWNAMVTHRMRIGDPTQIDAEVPAWLKQDYVAA